MAMSLLNIDKREAILNATLELLSCCGFHGFSIKQLAAKANVATGTVYLYFEDRDTLIRELHRTIMQRFAKAIFTDHDPHQNLASQHHRLCCNLWHFLIENPTILLSKVQFDHLPPDVLRSHRDEAWSLLQPLTALFEVGRVQGTIKNLPDDVLAGLSFEPLVYLARQHAIGVIEIEPDNLHELVHASWDAIAKRQSVAEEIL
ncbi:Transcriptional regulator, TetR family [Methylophaga frappieri]|uniref:Transcriptional regulator, TetR family n=1 Tax=Methylophaga frappieri (strain ATCC BAA-2434 / DSM 25690 / JAM7) TaxID=754477 RepID=I1YJ84_METFJ|nr:TetR/AcrR family transcriptional regulator [Methylophaga frappieri]AFJ02977.1 Transcriptional regulator, TetR family [Methylophaga frappieri]